MTRAVVTSLLLAAIVLLPGNSPATSPRKPQCHIDGRHADKRVGNAGCLVVLDGRLLLVRHERSGKLTFPGGYAESGETAQCTAHRETWEETGLEVRVGRVLKTFSNAFHLYACVLEGTAGVSRAPLEVPVTGHGEIREVLWMEAVALTAEDWRFPQFFTDVKTILASYQP